MLEIRKCESNNNRIGICFSNPRRGKEIYMEPWKEFLALYPEDEIYIKTSNYQDGQLYAELIPRAITYSNITVNYFTANQITLIISQMGYILGGMAISDPGFLDLPSTMIEQYKQKLLDGEVYFARFNIKFKKKFYLSKNAQAFMKIDKVKFFKNSVITNLSFRSQQKETIAEVITIFSLE